jgi:hypothetical protein
MAGLEQEIRADFGVDLRYITWHQGFVIHPTVSLWNFFESFRDHGVHVVNNDRERKADFYVAHGPELQLFGVSMTYDEILRGWRHAVPGTPTALADSIYEVYNRMRKESDSSNEWNAFTDQSWEVKNRFWDRAAQAFSRYEENALAPVRGPLPDLAKSPSLFDQVSKSFPWRLYRQAKLYALTGESPIVTPGAEHWDELDEDEFNDEYFPSVATLHDVFWGRYLRLLAEQKGYELEYATQCRGISHRHLKMGRALAWGVPGMPSAQLIVR